MDNIGPMTVEQVKNHRILLCYWAYAYEVKSVSLVDDNRYDELSILVESHKLTPTGNPKLDTFFKDEFKPHTGMWVWHYPEFNKLEFLYESINSDK